MSALADYAALPSAQDASGKTGPQSKRKRTQPASSSQFTDNFDTNDGPSRSIPSSDDQINDQVQHLKQAIGHLEDLLRTRSSDSRSTSHLNAASQFPPQTAEYIIDPHQDCPGEQDPPSPESRQRWHHLRSLLPPLIDTHVMMHYLLVEGDWLLFRNQAPRFVARWRHAFERQAISAEFAAHVLTMVATSALFISENPQRAIRFAVPIRSLHTVLAKEAVRIVDDMPASGTGRTEAETCDLIALMLDLGFYFRCIGKDVLMGRYTDRATSFAIRAGFDNELRPSWLGLTQDQIERRRIIMMEVNLGVKWLGFHGRKYLAHLRIASFNLGQAHLQQVGQLPPMSAWPQSDDIARTLAAHTADAHNTDSDRFFAWRDKSDQECDAVRAYVLVSTSLSDELPAIVELVSNTEAKLLQPEALAKCTKDEMRDMARQTRAILSKLKEWVRVILPRSGLGYDRAVNATITTVNPAEAKCLAIVLMVNHAVFYMTSIVCRAWLLLSDRLHSLNDLHRDNHPEYDRPTVNQAFMEHFKQRSIDHVQHMHAAWLPSSFLPEIEAVVLENGRQAIRTIPIIRTLQSQSSSQFYVGWICQSFLQAAVNLAVPLVRSHQRLQNDTLSQTDSEACFGASSTDELRRDVATIVEAVSQLSDNWMAKKTSQVLQRAMKLGGMETAPQEEIEDPWEVDERGHAPGQMQNAAEGLALLSEASASARTPTDGSGTRHSGSSDSNSPTVGRPWDPSGRSQGGFALASQAMVNAFGAPPLPTHLPSTETSSFHPTGTEDGGMSREPMWWEARPPLESHNSSGSATAGFSGLGGTSQYFMSDSQLLEELLNFDPSFWQFVVDGSGLTGATA